VTRDGAASTPGELTVPVRTERDIVRARTAGKDFCRRLGFRPTDQVKIVTAISELARNIVLYAGSGAVELRALAAERRGIEVVARDQGPGITDVDGVLARRIRSRTGLGLGLVGTQRLMDYFDLQTSSDIGTTVVVRKYLS
jgi:serine/threonine-protein kinase RsbT